MIQAALRIAAELFLETTATGIIGRSAFRKLVTTRKSVAKRSRYVGGKEVPPFVKLPTVPKTVMEGLFDKGPFRAPKTMVNTTETALFQPPIPPGAPGGPRIPVPGRQPPSAPGPSPQPDAGGVGGHAGELAERATPKKDAVNPAATPDPTQLASKIDWGAVADRLSQLAVVSQGLAGKYWPSMTWTGTVKATGYPTTPARTVIHYALAVAFGLITQTKIGGTGLHVEFDYDTNTAYVSYTSNSSILTEALNFQLLGVTGELISPEAVKQIGQGIGQIAAANGRGIYAGIKNLDVGTGIAEIATQNIQGVSSVIQGVATAYANIGRQIGPAGVWDMGAETIFGGRSSALLRLATPDLPSPYKEMVQQPMLTRLPAPNPQPPAPPQARNGDSTSGYSVDLRSLVTQVFYDPTILPPYPDTNVSLPPVYDMGVGG